MKLIQGSYEKISEHCKSEVGDHFEFVLSYTPMTEHFREIDRYLWESRHQMTRYRNNYEGKVVINLTSWNPHYPNEYFDAFMYLLKSKEGQIDVTFTVENICNSKILERLESFFNIEIISLEDGRTTQNISRQRTIGFQMNEEVYQYV